MTLIEFLTLIEVLIILAYVHWQLHKLSKRANNWLINKRRNKDAIRKGKTT